MTKSDLEQFTVVTNPFRTFSSSSTGGATGNVNVFSRQSDMEKDVGASSAFVDLSRDDGSIDDLLRHVQYAGRAARYAVTSSLTGSFFGMVSAYMDAVTSASVSTRKQSTVTILRSTPSVTFTQETLKKSLVRDLLNPWYRTLWPSANYAYTNYHSLNFFTSSTVPSDTALLYPNVSSPVPNATSHVSGTYSLSGAFSFDFYVNPRYQSFLTDGQFKAGTLLHLTGCYAVSLVTGSLKDVNGRPQGFRVMLQLSQSANVPPSQVLVATNANSSSVPSWANGSLIFLSDDNALQWNNWHHVVVRWGGTNINAGTGSFNVDGVDKGRFSLGSSSICPASPMPSGLSGPEVLVVGNYFEGSNSSTGSMSYFFAADPALRDGLTQLNVSTGVDEPTSYSFNHPLNAEVHDVSIKRYYMSDAEISISASIGLPFVDPKRIAFYLPPFFTEASPLRQTVGDHGGILQTPFFEVNGTTTHPFNTAMAFGVGGHYINLENFVKDFANGTWPKLHKLTGSAITQTTQLATANQFLYSQPRVVKRNLSILPCDDGNFIPSYALLLSQTLSSSQVDDLGTRRPELINLLNMVPSSSFLFGTDFDGDSTFLDLTVGPTPEQPGLAPGPAYLQYRKTAANAVARGTFTVDIQAGAPLDVVQRTRDTSSDQVTTFDISNLYYGKQVMPTSFIMSDTSFSASGGAVRITLRDDGLGNLFRGDCFTSQSSWNSVGNLYYGEGLAFIKSPHLYTFGKEAFTTTFRGTQGIHVMKVNLIAPANQLNSSSNPSYQLLPSSQYPNDPGTSFVYISDINLHDDDLNVVAKASLAQPILKRSGDRIAFRLKLDW